MSWLKRGEELRSKDFLESNVKKQVREFWLKPGLDKARKVIFIDDPVIGFKQHTFKVNDQFDKYTCLESDCPACAKGYYASPVTVMTILDLTPYTDKDGKQKPYYKTIYAVRGQAMMNIIEARRSANGGSLAGIKMQIMRSTDKEPSSGDDLQVLGKVDLSKLPVESKEDLVALDYEKLYAPISASKLEAVMKYAAPPTSYKKKSATATRQSLADFGETSSAGDVSATDEIPF